jgi:hypothetical protein
MRNYARATGLFAWHKSSVGQIEHDPLSIKSARTDVRHPANTIEDVRRVLVGYRDNMRVEIESGVAVTAKNVADLRVLPTWPDGLVLDIHVDLTPD